MGTGNSADLLAHGNSTTGSRKRVGRTAGNIAVLNLFAHVGSAGRATAEPVKAGGCVKGRCHSAARRRRIRHRLRGIVAFVAGLGLLAGLVAWLGLDTVVTEFLALGWVLPLLLVLGIVKHGLRAWAWKLALSAEQLVLPFPGLLAVRLRAQALAYVSSMGALVSEPLKPWLLRDRAAIEKTVPATVAEAGIYWFASLLVAIAGVPAALGVMADPEGLRVLIPVWLAFSGVLLWLLLRKQALLEGLVKLLRRRGPSGSKWLGGLDKAASFEKQARSFRMRNPRTASRILRIDLLVQLVMGAEVLLVLVASDSAVSLLLILAIESSGRIVKMMTFYVPARIGADEAGAAGAFLLLGLSPAVGLTLALARRLQGLLWTAVGLASFAVRPAPTGALSPASETQHGKVDSSCRL